MNRGALQPIEIVGGGLAGLSLGLALRRTDVPVTLHDAGTYPRHRVCGEFITGLPDATIERLGVAPLLAAATPLHEVVWFRDGRAQVRHRLPRPALALSRHALDQSLAGAFAAAGGDLRTHSRVTDDTAPAGRVFAGGRRRESPDWIGLKCHAIDLPLEAELEVHLGDHAYVGLCPVGDGRVNVSGLFRRRPAETAASSTRETALPSWLRARGLDALADRLDRAEIDPESRSAVAGLGFSRPAAVDGRLRIGDAFAMIPPFTGHGMAMAFQGAELALDPLLAWSRGETGWDATVHEINRRQRRLFRRRLAVAGALHPFLFEPHRQALLATAGRLGLLPVTTLYSLTHD